MGWKKTAVERRLRLKTELHQLEEDEVIEEDDVFVPETAPNQTMALMDVAVAQDRVDVSLNNDNPFFTAHSTGASLPYPNPPETNADVDDVGEIDLSVSLDVDVDVDAALDADDGGGHDEEVVFKDDVSNNFSSDDDADNADPLRPFHPGTLSGNDAAVKTLCLCVNVRKDPKRRIIFQGGEGDAFHVDYEELTKKLSPGESKFCVTAFHIHSIFYTISYSLLLFFRTENQFDCFLVKTTTVPYMTSKKTFWNALVTGLRGWCSVRAWDDIICDGTITKEVQANHIERIYHMYILLLAAPIDMFSHLLEHHYPHKAYGPGVQHRGSME
jgi:hypothetical protein